MKITIDLHREMTMQQYALVHCVPYATVLSWVRRGHIKKRTIPELNNLILVQVGSEKKLKKT